MEWTRSETIALGSNSCTLCHGFGLRLTEKRGIQVPCACVFRAIFRACYSRFRQCAEKEKYISQVSLQYFESGKASKRSWGRRDEEYMADFCLISKRELTETEYKIFRYHFLLGADWKLCCRQMAMDRGSFFHMVYRIQQKLGRSFRELEPYSLFPLDEYFGGGLRRATVSEPVTPKERGKLIVMQKPRRGRPPKLQPPMMKIA